MVLIPKSHQTKPAARKFGSNEVIETLADVMLWRGIPEYIRSDNGPEFVGRGGGDRTHDLRLKRPLLYH
jgi:hypothetical protein